LTARPPLPDSLTIASQKVEQYLLNPRHPKGGSKAQFFLGFGFTVDMIHDFADALFAQAMASQSFTEEPTAYGRSIVSCVGQVWTPSGRLPWIRTVWLVGHDDVAHLVTVVPDRDPSR